MKVGPRWERLLALDVPWWMLELLFGVAVWLTFCAPTLFPTLAPDGGNDTPVIGVTACGWLPAVKVGLGNELRTLNAGVCGVALGCKLAIVDVEFVAKPGC